MRDLLLKTTALAREVLASVRAQRAVSGMMGAVGFLVCFVVLATTGQSAATRSSVLATIDDLSTTLVVVTDDSGSGALDPGMVAVIDSYSQTQWAFGLGEVLDAKNADLSGRTFGVPLRAVVGELPAAIAPVDGRSPSRPNEAWVGQSAFAELGMASAAGTVTANGAFYGVVGTFSAPGPMANLESTILVPTGSQAIDSVRYIYANAENSASAEALAASITQLLPEASREMITVELGTGALVLKDALSARLDRGAQTMLALVLGVGAVLSVVVTHVMVATRRRDIGRRRALGATRSNLVALVLMQNVVCTTIGGLAGCAAGLVAVWSMTRAVPSGQFTAAVLGLSLVSALVGCVVPAVRAAHLEPVRILRVP